MSSLKTIRERLELSQSEIGAVLGVTQSNVSFYENGQAIPPKVASKLIEYARRHGLDLSYDHVYGGAALPPQKRPAKAQARSARHEGPTVTHEAVDPADALPTAAELHTQSEADHATCGAARHPNAPRGTGREQRHERRHGPCDPREGY